jgi:hypothetical protein
VQTGAEGEDSGTDLMEISRPDGLGDIANLGLTQSEAKLLLANVQREIAAAQATDHVVRRPDCPRCDGVCHVKDYRDHGRDAVRSGHGEAAPISLCQVWWDRDWYQLAICTPWIRMKTSSMCHLSPGRGRRRRRRSAKLAPNFLDQRRTVS